MISALLAPWEGVIAPATGHICTHEAGAIEATGHKVLELPQREGKLSAAELRTYLEGFYGDENHEHMVFPGMVYLSWPTELGTLYTRAELGGDPQGVPAIQDTAVPGRRPDGLWAGQPGERHDPGGPGGQLRRVLHRGGPRWGPCSERRWSSPGTTPPGAL